MRCFVHCSTVRTPPAQLIRICQPRHPGPSPHPDLFAPPGREPLFFAALASVHPPTYYLPCHPNALFFPQGIPLPQSSSPCNSSGSICHSSRSPDQDRDGQESTAQYDPTNDNDDDEQQPIDPTEPRDGPRLGVDALDAFVDLPRPIPRLVASCILLLGPVGLLSFRIPSRAAAPCIARRPACLNHCALARHS